MERRNISHSERMAIKQAWGNACAYCEVPLEAFEIDHIVAHANGGTCDVENLCVSCPSCNRRKGASPLPKLYEGLLLTIAQRKAPKIKRRLLLAKIRLSNNPKCPARAVFGDEYFKKYLQRKSSGNTHYVTSEQVNGYLSRITEIAKQRAERFHE